ncbi:protodermal factor 1-like [Triticum dicoccoides]|uniref:protodermal factor 1-like n=1 Tax=Triticum dicoccoides TaxID=85692 RepID=UPI000E7CDD5F|nr:protodermal factor 1-like [Triticum dicoccoides]
MGAQRALLASFLLAALATQAFVAVSARTSPTDKASQDDVKKPDCVPSLDPHNFPGHGGTTVPLPSHGGSSGTPPYHGGSGTTPSHGGSGSTPSHSGSGSTVPDPSHGGYGTPPSHGGSGSLPDPSHSGGGYGSTPDAPSHGGGAYGSSPTPSTGGAYGSSPTPSHDGGAYGSSPTPAHDGGSYSGTPAAPSHSSHGSITPTPLIPVDPNSLGTCDYWRTHPMQIWLALGSWPSSVSHFFGAAGGAVAGGPSMSIQDALANTRTDGAGALLREGTAALLNSMTRPGFAYTTQQVRDAFAAAVAGGSDSAAAAQAAAFKKANEGKKV